MKILIDMNLSPLWVRFLSDHGHEALHWSEVGDPRAPDPVLLSWARDRDYILFSNDLDFSRLLALTFADGPSVFQVRTEDLLPSAIGDLVLQALEHHAVNLATGALVVLDASTLRVRLLPLK